MASTSLIYLFNIWTSFFLLFIILVTRKQYQLSLYQLELLTLSADGLAWSLLLHFLVVQLRSEEVLWVRTRL